MYYYSDVIILNGFSWLIRNVRIHIKQGSMSHPDSKMKLSEYRAELIVCGPVSSCHKMSVMYILDNSRCNGLVKLPFREAPVSPVCWGQVLWTLKTLYIKISRYLMVCCGKKWEGRWNDVRE